MRHLWQRIIIVLALAALAAYLIAWDPGEAPSGQGSRTMEPCPGVPILRGNPRSGAEDQHHLLPVVPPEWPQGQPPAKGKVRVLLQHDGTPVSDVEVLLRCSLSAGPWQGPSEQRATGIDGVAEFESSEGGILEIVDTRWIPRSGKRVAVSPHRLNTIEVVPAKALSLALRDRKGTPLTGWQVVTGASPANTTPALSGPGGEFLLPPGHPWPRLLFAHDGHRRFHMFFLRMPLADHAALCVPDVKYHTVIRALSEDDAPLETGRVCVGHPRTGFCMTLNQYGEALVEYGEWSLNVTVTSPGHTPRMVQLFGEGIREVRLQPTAERRFAIERAAGGLAPDGTTVSVITRGSYGNNEDVVQRFHADVKSGFVSIRGLPAAKCRILLHVRAADLDSIHTLDLAPYHSDDVTPVRALHPRHFVFTLSYIDPQTLRKEPWNNPVWVSYAGQHDCRAAPPAGLAALARAVRGEGLPYYVSPRVIAFSGVGPAVRLRLPADDEQACLRFGHEDGVFSQFLLPCQTAGGAFDIELTHTELILPTDHVAIQLILPDGTPASNFDVRLVFLSGDEPDLVTGTDGLGRFRLRGGFGRNYDIWARSTNGQEYGTTIHIGPPSGPASVLVILAER